MAIEGTVPATRTGDAGSRPAVAVKARSTAMWLMPIAAVIEVLITINVMLSIGFVPPLVVFRYTASYWMVSFGFAFSADSNASTFSASTIFRALS